MPLAKPVVEDLITWMGLRTPLSADTTQAQLDDALAAAIERVEERINLPTCTGGLETSDDNYPPHVRLAILMQANRYAKRPGSAAGVAGFGEVGVVRIMALDPDVETLLALDLRLDGFS